jgi:hypothetical protein
MRPDSELIRESVCACAKLFVDEESTWHKSNRGLATFNIKRKFNSDSLYAFNASMTSHLNSMNRNKTKLKVNSTVNIVHFVYNNSELHLPIKIYEVDQPVVFTLNLSLVSIMKATQRAKNRI